jgi:hypothetical protein
MATMPFELIVAAVAGLLAIWLERTDRRTP